MRPLIGVVLWCAVGCQKPAGSTVVPTERAGSSASASASASINPESGRGRLLACCKSCAEAAARDPAGQDLAVVPCTKYRGEWQGRPGIDASCAALFVESMTTVGDCWALTK